jgi:hypothetical protein
MNEPGSHDPYGSNGSGAGNGPGAEPDDLYADIERRALFDMPDEEPGEDDAPDIIGSLTGAAEAPAKDMTLGGYIEEHDRVPAFEGSDGQPYTIDIDVVEEGGGFGVDRGAAGAPAGDAVAEGSFVAFLVFIRWAATGAGIMDHIESGDVARGRTGEEARRSALELSLYEIKAELDAAIERRREALED